jgi:hypothetical protein
LPDQKDILVDKIRDMAKLGLMANRINEVQEKNLKMYPFIYFWGVKSVRIDYDLSNNNTVNIEDKPEQLSADYKFEEPNLEHLRVTYYLEMAPSEQGQNHHMEERFKHLEKSVRTLFWKEVLVEVYFNSTKAYPHE